MGTAPSSIAGGSRPPSAMEFPPTPTTPARPASALARGPSPSSRPASGLLIPPSPKSGGPPNPGSPQGGSKSPSRPQSAIGPPSPLPRQVLVAMARPSLTASGNITLPSAVTSELRWCELASPAMQHVLAQVSQDMDGDLVVGLGRYALHLPSLKGILTSLSVFRPKLSVNDNRCHVSFDMSDLTAAPGCVTGTIPHRAPPKLLLTSNDVSDLAVLVAMQDRHQRFRSCVQATSEALALLPGRPQGCCNNILVLVTDNLASANAVEAITCIARPTDSLHLLHVAASDVHVSSGKALIDKLMVGVLKVHPSATANIIVKNHTPFMELINSYAQERKVKLLVMGSQTLGSSGGGSSGSSTTGSLAIQVAKTLPYDVLVVTNNTKYHRINWGKEKMRVMVLCDWNTRPMMRSLCNDYLDARRGVQLLLTKADPNYTAGRQNYHTRKIMSMLEGCADIASLGHFHTVKRPIQGAMETVLPHIADQERVHLTALQVSSNHRSFPLSIVQLIRNIRCAVLLVKSETT